jgi:hypothetical protein
LLDFLVSKFVDVCLCALQVHLLETVENSSESIKTTYSWAEFSEAAYDWCDGTAKNGSEIFLGKMGKF